MEPNFRSLASRIKSALDRRLSTCLTLPVCRLFDEEEVSDFFLDRYGALAIAHLLPKEGVSHNPMIEAFSGALSELRDELEGRWGVTTLYLRVHPRDSKQHRSVAPILLWGSEEREHLVEEEGIRFILRPKDSVHGGLFADMREVRAWVRSDAQGKRVLNLFAFTGSLGIVAAVGGALEVCQVDSSPTAIEWARKNWELNKREMTMKILGNDCRHFLDREIARVEAGGKRTDMVLLDPPSFGRGRKRTFAIKRDLGELVEKGMRILTPRGAMLITTNTRSFSPAHLREIADGAADRAGWKIGRSEDVLPPSTDFVATGYASIAMRGIKLFGVA